MSHETATTRIESPITASPGILSHRDQIRPLLGNRNTETISQQMGDAVRVLMTLKMPNGTGRILAGFGVFGVAAGVTLSILSPGGGSRVEAVVVPTATPVPRISFQCYKLVNPRVDSNPSDGRLSDARLLERWRTVYKRGPRSTTERDSDYKLEERMGADSGTIIMEIGQNVQITGGDCEIKNADY